MRTRIIVIAIISLLTMYVANKAKNSIENTVMNYQTTQEKVINDILNNN